MGVKNIGLLEITLDHCIHKARWSFVILITLLASQRSIDHDVQSHFVSDTFEINFSQFSPAFAAFEDESLFARPLLQQSSLKADTSNQSFSHLVETHKSQIPLTLVRAVAERPPFQSTFIDQFDGEESVQPTSTTQQKWIRPSIQAAALEDDELKFGALASMVNPHTSNNHPSLRHLPTLSTSSTAKHIDQSLDSQSADDNEKAPQLYDSYIVSGGIQLKGGLAFLGSMEVSWVVGDYELQIGSINSPDATYEIEVHQLVGDVIVSLYDNRDELIGEGILDLATAQLEGSDIFANIDIHPIDWSTAGHIILADSIGSGVEKPVENVEVALYSFNDATETNSQGEFHFPDWKKTNSKTLAIASKEGFRDSIFMLDSHTEASVLLFREKSMDAFFDYLDDLGLRDLSDQGTIYGQIHGIKNKAGYTLTLKDEKTIYFLDSGFASLEQNKTSSNGLFSFVGLEDGDYQLIVEKDGEIVDERIAIVEQGKISPIVVDLSKVSKHIEFFDPMKPDRQLSSLEVSFFDGSTSIQLDPQNSLNKNLHRGHDVAIMEFATDQEISRTLLSRNRGLQKVPLLQDQQVLKLAREQKFEVENGLIIGFIDSTVPYSVSLAEEEPQQIVYFNQEGQIIDERDEVAHGFIIYNFSEGLSSLIITDLAEQTIVGTDLIYSDHQSISMTYLEVLEE